MISPATYENMSIDLENASEEVVYNVAIALTILNKSVIKDTGNLARSKIIYDKTINKIASTFKKKYTKWIDEEIKKSYILGIKSADQEIKSIISHTNIIKEQKEIINGYNLIKAQPISNYPNVILKEYPEHKEFLKVFSDSAYYSLEDKPFQILRKSNDLYRKTAVLIGEKTFTEGNILTRTKLSQQLLNEYAKKGLQCVKYKDGKVFSIDSYCEMLGRTMTGRCSLQASLNRYVQRGYQLGVVSAHFRSCDLCSPFEGTILSLDGKSNVYPSIWDAETQGLWHPNCKHDISPFFEEITTPLEIRTDRAEQILIDEYGYNEAQKIAYKAQQKQRYIERQIRKYKRYELVSLDEVSKVRAKNKVLYWQKQQRIHLKENSFLPRKYNRESIN